MYTNVDFYPKKKTATGFIGYIPTVLFLFIFACIIMFLFSLFNKDFKLSILYASVAIILYLLVYIMSLVFDWFLEGSLTYHKDKNLLEYIEKGVVAIGSNKSKYKMNTLNRIVKKKNSIWLYGEIDAIEGIHKSILKKLELRTYDKTEEVYNLVMNFYNDNKES